jgi:hypothetical protein
VIGEAEKPVVAELAAVAHESNLDPKAVQRLVAKYYEIQDKQRQAGRRRRQVQGRIRRRAAQGLAGRRLPPQPDRGQQPDRDVAGRSGLGLLAGRDPNGRKLGDNPAFIRSLPRSR